MIRCTSAAQREGFTAYQLKTGKAEVIGQNCWPSDRVTCLFQIRLLTMPVIELPGAEDTRGLLNLLEDLEKWQQNTGDHTVTVCCL